MVKDKENKVYKLVKSLYGLKQAPKQWHDKFGSIMTFDGYVIYESILFFFFFFTKVGGEGMSQTWDTQETTTRLVAQLHINESYKCLYTKFDNGCGVIICLYVDDILIFGTLLDIVKDTKKFLTSQFDMKDIDCANVILGIKLLRKDENFVTISL